MIGEVGLRHVRRRPIALDASVPQPQRVAAQLLHVVHAVRAEQQRAAVCEIALQPGDALLLERLVADREHLVGDQDVRAHRGRDREAEAHDHARRVVLDRLVDVLADVGEVDDLVALGAISLGPRPSSAPASSMLSSPVYSGWKPLAELEQRADAAVDDDACRASAESTPAMILSSVDLPAPFSPITPSDAPRLHREAHAVERAEDVRGARGRAAGPTPGAAVRAPASTFA